MESLSSKCQSQEGESTVSGVLLSMVMTSHFLSLRAEHTSERSRGYNELLLGRFAVLFHHLCSSRGIKGTETTQGLHQCDEVLSRHRAGTDSHYFSLPAALGAGGLLGAEGRRVTATCSVQLFLADVLTRRLLPAGTS